MRRRPATLFTDGYLCTRRRPAGAMVPAQRRRDDRLCRVRAFQGGWHLRHDDSGRHIYRDVGSVSQIQSVAGSSLAAWLSLALVVIGTLIWAYGDLLFPETPEDAEEQTAIIWCGLAPIRPLPRRSPGTEGRFHRLKDVSIVPMPVQRPIPI
jgi:hypothetical protein